MLFPDPSPAPPPSLSSPSPGLPSPHPLPPFHLDVDWVHARDEHIPHGQITVQHALAGHLAHGAADLLTQGQEYES